MENANTSFQCPHCNYRLVVKISSSESVTSPCPVCANVITSEPATNQLPARKILKADLEPEIEVPILLNPPRREFRRGRFTGSRRSTKLWFKSELDTPTSSNGVPLVIKRRRKATFAKPDQLADRLERLSQSAK